MSSRSSSQASHVDELDTMVGMPAVEPCAPPSEAPPPKNSECRALFVPRPPRPTPRLKAVPSGGPPPLPIAAKTAEPTEPTEPNAANDTKTMEIDPSCIEEVRAIAAAEPTRARAATPAPPHVRAVELARSASRALFVLLRAMALFVVYVAAAAAAWLRASFFPAARAAAAAARGRVTVEWARASASARR